MFLKIHVFHEKDHFEILLLSFLFVLVFSSVPTWTLLLFPQTIFTFLSIFPLVATSRKSGKKEKKLSLEVTNVVAFSGKNGKDKTRLENF